MTNGGIDLGRRMSQICILKQDGEVIEQRIKSERERFAAVFKAHPGARILIEAGTESEWLHGVSKSWAMRSSSPIRTTRRCMGRGIAG